MFQSLDEAPPSPGVDNFTTLPAWMGCEERRGVGAHQDDRRGREQHNLACEAEPVKPKIHRALGARGD